MTERILVAGLEAASKTVADSLEEAGYRLSRALSLAQCLNVMERHSVGAVVVCLEDGNSFLGLGLVRELATRSRIPIIAVGDSPLLSAAAHAGALELVLAPSSSVGLSAAIRRAIHQQTLALSVADLRREVAPLLRSVLIGESGAMGLVRSAIAQVCTSDVDLLVRGEQGVGKTQVATQIHHASIRAEGPLVRIDPSLRPIADHEALLFGDRDRPGALAAAHGGTLVISEPTALRPALQAALFRSLRERSRRTRSETVPLDIRVIATSHRELAHQVSLGEFDEELFARLTAVTLLVEPLRARGNDVLQLAAHFAAEIAHARGKAQPHLSAEACHALLTYDWPGNVGELKEAIEAATALDPRIIERDNLPRRILNSRQVTPAAAPPRQMPTLDDVERRYVDEVLAAVDGNKSRASRVLGLNRRTLYRMLRRHDSKVPRDDGD